MALGSPLLGSLISQRDHHTRSTGLVWSTLIALVSFHPLSIRNHVNQTMAEDLHVRPSPARIGSIDPNNLTSLNADSNFIADPRLLELVRVPLLGPRSWLPDPEVSAIDSDLALLAFVIAKPLAPPNLPYRA
jgi:hypothetical protein